MFLMAKRVSLALNNIISHPKDIALLDIDVLQVVNDGSIPKVPLSNLLSRNILSSKLMYSKKLEI